MNLAPVILFVYNRPWHTEQTLEALMLNELADQSTLYIYCDGPKDHASDESLKNIKEVRTVIRKKNWCKEVIIRERTKNFGLAESVIKGVSDVIEKHGRVIVLEDDIVTGKYFLKFMNDGLNIYENEPQVFGVSGYKFPSIKEVKEPTYFLPISSSWSYATWSDRWNKVNFNGNLLLKKIDENKLNEKLDFGGYPFYSMLKDQIKGKNDSWAVRFYASMLLDGAYFLFPQMSLIENIGFDNSGTHCGTDDYFSNVKISNEKIKVNKKNVKLNNRIVLNFRKSFKLRYYKKKRYKKIRIKNILKGLFVKVFQNH